MALALDESCRGYKSGSQTFRAKILETLAITGFIKPYILHPVQGFHIFLPTMGVTSFDPQTGIGDLGGKVIFVTGGPTF